MDHVEDYMGKRVFVTGDTGFKGRWLVDCMTLLGAEVVGYSLPKDIRHYGQLSRALSSSGADIVFHLAAQAIVSVGYDDPETTFATNVSGTTNLLEWLRVNSPETPVVCVTSDKCYLPQSTPCTELSPLGGRDPYSASKAAAEMVAASYRDSYGMNISTARAGNVIGGGDDHEGRIMVDIVSAVFSGRAIKLRSPNAVRPWQHVLDCLNGYLMLGAAMMQSEEYAGAWNFGPDHSHTVEEMIEAVKAYLPLKVEYAEPTFVETQYLALNSDKARAALGWCPRWGFERSIKETILGYQGRSRKEQIEDFIVTL